MATQKSFSIFDLFKFANVNLDPLTETFNTGFYGTYLVAWPEYCHIVYNSMGQAEGYILGKIEGNRFDESKKDWHAHVSAVTVAPEFRREGIARKLMDILEKTAIIIHNAFFVDLFVRSTNVVAITMYKALGYDVYRTVKGYYSGDKAGSKEDAYDMRKSLPRDAKKECMVAKKKEIEPHELEYV